jgi:hypothetical protein
MTGLNTGHTAHEEAYQGQYLPTSEKKTKENKAWVNGQAQYSLL